MVAPATVRLSFALGWFNSDGNGRLYHGAILPQLHCHKKLSEFIYLICGEDLCLNECETCNLHNSEYIKFYISLLKQCSVHLRISNSLQVA